MIFVSCNIWSLTWDGGKLKYYFHSLHILSGFAFSFLYWFSLSDSKFSFLQLLKLPKCSHATTCPIVLVPLPFLSATITSAPVTSSLCRGFQCWQHERQRRLYSGLQRHSTITTHSWTALLWLPKSGRLSRWSISSFLWRCFWTPLHCNRMAQRLQKWVQSTWSEIMQRVEH